MLKMVYVCGMIKVQIDQRNDSVVIIDTEKLREYEELKSKIASSPSITRFNRPMTEDEVNNLRAAESLAYKRFMYRSFDLNKDWITIFGYNSSKLMFHGKFDKLEIL